MAAQPLRPHRALFLRRAYFPLAWDLYSAYASPRGIWRYIFPLTFIWSHSVVYELIEWLAAEVFGGDLGVAYLGAQGDEWDAQKDSALAAAGALLALMVAAMADFQGLMTKRSSTLETLSKIFTGGFVAACCAAQRLCGVSLGWLRARLIVWI